MKEAAPWNLLVLSTILVLTQVASVSSCIAVSSCPADFQLPISEKLSYEIDTTEWNDRRKICPRSDIVFWEIAVKDPNSNSAQLLPGEYCIYPDSPVAITDVCVINGGETLIFTNTTNLLTISGTITVGFSSSVYNTTLPIQFSPTGVYVSSSIAYIVSNTMRLLLDWFIYLPITHTGFSISHDGVLIANGSSSMIQGYGSINLDTSVCVPAVSGGEVTEQYTLLIDKPSEKFTGEYNMTVYDSTGQYSGVISVELGSSYLFPLVPSPSPTLSVSLTPSIAIAPSSSLVPVFSLSDVTLSSSSSSSPSVSSTISSSTSSSILSLSGTSSTPPITTSSATPTSSTGSDNTIMTIVSVVLTFILLIVVIPLVVIAMVYIIRKWGRGNAVRDPESQTQTYRQKKLSTVVRPLELSIVDNPLPQGAAPPQDLPTQHFIDTGFDSSSSSRSDGSRRDLLKTVNYHKDSKYLKDSIDGNSSIVSSGNSTPKTEQGGHPRDNGKPSLTDDLTNPSLVTVMSSIDKIDKKLDKLQSTEQVKNLSSINDDLCGVNEKLDRLENAGAKREEKLDEVVELQRDLIGEFEVHAVKDATPPECSHNEREETGPSEGVERRPSEGVETRPSEGVETGSGEVVETGSGEVVETRPSNGHVPTEGQTLSHINSEDNARSSENAEPNTNGCGQPEQCPTHSDQSNTSIIKDEN